MSETKNQFVKVAVSFRKFTLSFRSHLKDELRKCKDNDSKLYFKKGVKVINLLLDKGYYITKLDLINGDKYAYKITVEHLVNDMFKNSINIKNNMLVGYKANFIKDKLIMSDEYLMKKEQASLQLYNIVDSIYMELKNDK